MFKLSSISIKGMEYCIVLHKDENIKRSSFKSSENIYKKENGSDRSGSNNKSSSVILNELTMKARESRDTVISTFSFNFKLVCLSTH